MEYFQYPVGSCRIVRRSQEEKTRLIDKEDCTLLRAMIILFVKLDIGLLYAVWKITDNHVWN